jgi:phospholipid transport system substrate-binding protein
VFAAARKEIIMTNLHKWALIVLLGTFLVGEAGKAELWASSPSEQLKTAIDQVFEILKNPKLQGADKKAERREKLRQVILPRFDFAEMAKRALGSNWNRYPDQQREFVTVFKQLLEDTYADQIEAAKGDKVVYLDKRAEKDYAEVDTKVISAKGEETPMTYKLHPVGSEWKVYDIVVENISIVNNYRSQFNRVLSNASLDELIKRMRDKREEKSS